MMAQMQAAQTTSKGGGSADGTVQVGINLEKMMENQNPKQKDLRSNGWQFPEQVNISLALQLT